jgi:hypothetical protein
MIHFKKNFVSFVERMKILKKTNSLPILAIAKNMKLTAFLFSCIFMVSCASVPTSYIHPSSDFTSIKKVAVLPFSNFTQDQFAGQKIQDIFVIELLSRNIVDIAEAGEVHRILNDNRVTDVEKMSQDAIKKVGSDLGVQALVLGTVQEFQIDRMGPTASASVVLSFKMIEVDSGVVIWTTSVSREGAGLATKLFGFGAAKKSKVARDLVREALKSLIK